MHVCSYRSIIIIIIIISTFRVFLSYFKTLAVNSFFSSSSSFFFLGKGLVCTALTAGDGIPVGPTETPRFPCNGLTKCSRICQPKKQPCFFVCLFVYLLFIISERPRRSWTRGTEEVDQARRCGQHPVGWSLST